MNRPRAAPILRAFVVAGLAVGAGFLLLREKPPRPAATEPSTRGAKWLVARAGSVEAEEREALLRLARNALGQEVAPVGTDGGDHLAIVSLGRRGATALVGRGVGASWPEAVRAAGARIAALRDTGPPGRLKVDLLVAPGPDGWFDEDGRAAIDRSLDGLWLPEADLVLLPEELLAARLVSSHGDLQSKRLRRYLADSGRIEQVPRGNPGRVGAPYVPVRFESFAEGERGEATSLYRGNPGVVATDPQSLMVAAVAGGEYLLRHQRDDGSFRYVYQPKWDGGGDDYNLLRHAGACYALAELAGETGDRRFADGASRGVAWLLDRSRAPRTKDAGAGFRAIESPGEEAKLGGSALAILALLATAEATDEPALVSAALPLAAFLRYQQDEDGHFRSKYFFGAPDPDPFESVYYPGEAILALARLHRRDPDGGWLEVATRGADWLIEVRDADRPDAELPHDHWLLMGLDELYELTGRETYRLHAERIAGAIVAAQRTSAAGDRSDWVGSFYDPPRSTPTATRAEGLVAAVRLERAAGIPTESMRAALDRMAGFLMRCQLGDINGLYLPRPDLAHGGFRRSLTNWEVRIDYVQHAVSALLGYRSLKVNGRGGTEGSE